MAKENNDHLQNLAEIRTLMEQSSRFLSLSGLSGIFAGIFALIGAAAAYFYLEIGIFDKGYYDNAFIQDSFNLDFISFFLIDALSVLFLSLFVGGLFTIRNARKKKHKLLTRATTLMAINLFIPLAVGGMFCIFLAWYGLVYLVPPSTLIFYGLALFNGGKYTVNDIRYLGLFEILLGFAGCIWIDYGLLLWALGFGVLHIIYGIVMYNKYER